MQILKKLRFFLLVAIIIPTLSWADYGEMTAHYFPQAGETRYLCVLDDGTGVGTALPPTGGIDRAKFSIIKPGQYFYEYYLFAPPEGTDPDKCSFPQTPATIIAGIVFTIQSDMQTADVTYVSSYDGSIQFTPSVPTKGVTEIDATYIK